MTTQGSPVAVGAKASGSHAHKQICADSRLSMGPGHGRSESGRSEGIPGEVGEGRRFLGRKEHRPVLTAASAPARTHPMVGC